MIYRNKKWLQVVTDLPCVLCGNHEVQAAHRNEGKGMGMKTDDCLTAALCQPCHHEIDNGATLTKVERRARMDKAIVLTMLELVRIGKVGLIQS